MKVLFVISLFIFNVNAFAWSGSFIGEGKATYNQRSMDCEFIEIRFLKASDDSFILRGGGYKCGMIQAEYPYSVFKILNNELVYDGQIVGKLSDSKIELFFEEFSLVISKLSDDLVEYIETWEDDRDFLQISGQLQAF